MILSALVFLPYATSSKNRRKWTLFDFMTYFHVTLCTSHIRDHVPTAITG